MIGFDGPQLCLFLLPTTVLSGSSERMGSIYFLRARDRVKIGWSSHLQKRLKIHKTATVDDIELIGTVDHVPMRMERQVHRTLEHLRVAGKKEVFWLKDEVLHLLNVLSGKITWHEWLETMSRWSDDEILKAIGLDEESLRRNGWMT